MKITTVELRDVVRDDYALMVSWLPDVIGPGAIENVDAWADPKCMWSIWYNQFNSSYNFEFKNKNDAMLFQLTFSS